VSTAIEGIWKDRYDGFNAQHVLSIESSTKEKAFLYSLVVKDMQSGKSVPVAFMITTAETQSVKFSFIAVICQTQRIV
jgi:hypothetical protein